MPQSSQNRVRFERAGSTATEGEDTINIYARWTKKTAEKCKVRMVFQEKTASGKSIESYNGLPVDVTNTLGVGDSWTQKSPITKVFKVENQGYIYTIDGWYDKDGNKMTADDNNQISKFFKCEKGGDYTFTYTLKWNEYKAPIISFDYINKINNNNGTGSWSNENGGPNTYTHKFKEPTGTQDYKFLYWKLDGKDTTFQDGDSYTITSDGMEYGEKKEEKAYAWWQPGVKVNYYNDDKSEFKMGEWSFEDVQMISEKPTKPGYDFVAWVDEKGNVVDKTTFEVPEITTEPDKAVTYNLYAKFERTTMEVTINKVWEDNDNEKEKRTDSVNVSITLDDEEVESVEIKENSNKEWTTSVTLYKYDTQGNELNYTFKEDEVKFYTVSVSDLVDNVVTITNTIYGTGKVVVKYIDIDTEKELDSITLSGLYTESYETELKDFEGYELVSIVGETTGEFGEKDLEVIYYYTSNYGDEGEKEDVITPPHTDAVDSFGEQIVYFDDRKYKNGKA